MATMTAFPAKSNGANDMSVYLESIGERLSSEDPNVLPS